MPMTFQMQVIPTAYRGSFENSPLTAEFFLDKNSKWGFNLTLKVKLASQYININEDDPENFYYTNVIFHCDESFDTIEQATEAAKNAINEFKASI